MAFVGGGAERKSRRREEQERGRCGSNTGFFSEGHDSADDELANLMPVHKKRLEEEAGTLNFMGGVDSSNEEFFRESDDKENAVSGRRHSFHHSRRREGSGRITSPSKIDFDKLLKTGVSVPPGSLSKNITTAPLKENNVNDRDNAVSDRNSFYQSRKRQGSGRVTTPRPIDFDNLMITGAPTPSGSLYKNITTALKVKVTKAELRSQIADDFRSTEKKTSAVARRRLSGVKIPAQTNPKPVEDRRARHARSRRGGRNSRKLGEKSVTLDLYMDAAEIADWDQEILVEEEVAPASQANCGAFLSVGRPALQGNFVDLDQGRKEVAVQAGALEPARLGDDIEGDRSEARLGDDMQGDRREPNLGRDEPWRTNSPSSMELSAGQTPLVEVRDREKHGANPQEDSGSVHPHLIMENLTWKEPRVPDRLILEECDDVGAIGLSSGSSRHEREGHDSHPEEIVMLDPRPRDSNIKQKNSPTTPCKGFPTLGTSNLHIQRIPLTSPTPPSNPVAVYMSERYLGKDLHQRRLAFHSSPSSETMESSGGGEEHKSDSGEMHSSGDKRPGMEQLMTSTKEVQDGNCVLEILESRTDVNSKLDQMSTSKGDVEGENMDFFVADSRRNSYQSGLRHMTASKDEIECEKIGFVGEESWIDSSDGGLHCMIRSKVEGVRMVFGEGELLRDLCKRREHQMTALKDDIQGKRVVLGDIEPRRDLCHPVTHQMSAVGDIIQVEEELENPNKISCSAPCDGGTVQQDDQVSDLPEESLFVASCDRSIHHVDDQVRAQKAGEEDLAKKFLLSSVHCDDNNSGEDQKFNGTACDRSLGEHGLQAKLDDDAANDEELVVPDVGETEPVHHEFNNIIPPEQTDPNRLAPNHEESADEVAIKEKAQIPTKKAVETGDSEAIPACVDAQHDNANIQSVIGSDEGSSTQTGPKAPKRRRATKSLQDRRTSLEGSGSAWMDGHRRSQRMRFKPLDWWRGEKLLYGRVHQSLTTVIGIKRSSPGKYARGVYNPFIVESYVPDKYKELVRLAAI